MYKASLPIWVHILIGNPPIREFLCSEAMFHLGIPTSRAAAIVVSIHYDFIVA